MRGFSIIEIVVYIAVLSVISVTAVETIIVMNTSLIQIRTTRTLSNAASGTIERMARTIRDSKFVNVSSSIFDTSPGVLSLTGSGSSPATYRFSVSRGGLLLDTGGSQTVLTPPGVVVTNLVFRLIANSSVSQAIKIEFTIAASNGHATTTQNFYDTVLLRNSYAL